MSPHTPCIPLEAIFRDDAGWHFWDELWLRSQGPYQTRRDAEAELQKYVEHLDDQSR